ncbi:hypothetical protein Pfra02_44090 [Pseudomonas fragi]|nr:hypothetical protein Pfra02_44090 [Pseudomonas fragi]
MAQQSSRLDVIIDSRPAQRNGEQLRITLNNLNIVGDQTTRTMNGAGNAARAAGSAFAALGAGQVAREVIRLTDAFKSMQGSLALVSNSTSAASKAFNELLGMANNTGSSLESTVALYTRLANATKGVGYSQEQLLNVTDAINKAFVVSGATAQEASNAAIQLSQGLAAGALRGEELNSVMEQGPRITRALADYLGVTNGQIRAMAAEGKITAEVVTNALLGSLSELNEELARMPRRFENASTALKNNFLAAVGQVDIDPLISSVDALATSLADPKVIDGIQSIATGIGQVVAVGGSGLKMVVSNTDALMAITGAYAVKVGVGLANSLFVSAKARLVDLAATNQQIVASKQAEVASAAEAVAMQSVVVSSTEAALARAYYARSEAMATSQSELNSIRQLKAVTAQLAADRNLEIQRQKAQINNIGLAASHTRLAEIRTAEAAITSQLSAAEARLAVSRQAELATGAVVGQQTVALNAARTEGAGILAAQTAAQNALNAAESRGAATRGAALAALGGPLGLVTLGLAAAAAGYIYFSSSADSGTQSLIEQGLTLDETVEKFDQLTAAQQRNQASKWAEAQKAALDQAATSFAKYANVARSAISADSAPAFNLLLGEVKSGKKTLDDLTKWLIESQSVSGRFKTAIEELSASYDGNIQSAKGYGDSINAVATASNQAAGSTDRLAAAQSKAGDNQKVSAAAWDKYIEQLTKARDLVGANAAAEAEYTARKMGAAPAQIEEAKRIATQTDLLGKYQDAVKENNKAEQDRLKVLLLAAFTAQKAAEDSAAAQQKALKDTADAAELSAKRQVTAIEKVARASYASLLVKPESGNQSGYGLLTNGGIAPATPDVPRKTPQQLADEATARITAGTTPNKAKTPKGDSGKSALNAAMSAFDELYKKADPAAQAVRDLTEAQEKLQLALSKGKITQEQYGVALGQASRDYAAVLASTKAMNEAQNDQVQLLTLTGQLRAANTLKSSIDDAAQLVEYERQGNFEAAKRLETMIKIRDVNLQASLKPGTVEGVSEAPSVTGLDASVGGAYSEIDRLNAESAKVDAWRSMELEKQKAYLDLKAISEQTYADRVNNINQQGRDNQTKLEQAKNRAIMVSTSDFFGNMAVLSQSGNKKMAAIGKAAAIAQATISTYDSANKAYAALAGIPIMGPALGAAAAGAAIAAGLANVANIAGIGFSGGGYTGPGGVNAVAGTVHKGEVVWSQKDIQRFGGVAAVEALRKGDVSAVTSPSVSRGSLASPSGGAPQIKIYVSGDGSGGSANSSQGYEQVGLAALEAVSKGLADLRRDVPQIARGVIVQEKGQNGLLDPSNRRNQ